MPLLSNSPFLRCLSIDLGLEVWADYCSHSDDSDEGRNIEMMGAAHNQAVDIFMDSGILNSLRNLSTVESFEFVFDMTSSNSEYYQPQPRHVELIQDLQRVIQGNWQVKQGSRR